MVSFAGSVTEATAMLQPSKVHATGLHAIGDTTRRVQKQAEGVGSNTGRRADARAPCVAARPE